MDHELTPFFTPASSTSHQENADFDEIRRNLLDDLSQSVVADDVSLITMKEDGATLKTNELQHIKVYLRIRPATEVERSSGLVENCVTIENERSVTVTAPQQSHSYRSSLYGVTRQKQCFHFSRVFGEDTTQQQFYDETMKSTINEFIDGQNCLIFSYGVTNSGKTYTIHGDPHDERAGILPRSLNQIFSATVGSHVPGMQFKPVMFGEVARLTAEQVCLNV
jgi:kinesin family protein 20